MRTRLTVSSLLCLLASLTVLAQENPQRGSNLEQRFKQLDLNGDGKLTPNEAPYGDLFKQWDQNADGVVTLDEVRAYYTGGRPGQKRDAPGPATQQPSAMPMKTVRDVAYAKIEGTDPNLTSLDIYAPENAKGAPVMIYIHGGGWAQGDKSQVASLPTAFVSEGFVLVSANYRLAPAVKFDAQAQDVAAAIGWVNKHVAEYGGDSTRVFTMGHSAGAHLVALVATDESYLKAQGLPLKALRGVVPLDTEVYDVKSFASRFGGKLPDLYAAPFTQDPVTWAKASPVTHVAKDKGIPPMIVAYSGGPRPNGNPDRATYAEEFVKKLRDAGVTAEVVGAPEKTHAQIALEFGTPNDAVAKKVFAFLRERLHDPRPPLKPGAGWPQFRGPAGSGVASGANLPDTWDAKQNVRWVAEIPGKGYSSPVVAGERIFLTTAVAPGKVEPPRKNLTFADQVTGETTKEAVEYRVLCLDRATGKLLWEQTAHKAVPKGPIHPKNSYASETPATDGERVYALFSSVGLFCYDIDGKLLWSHEVPPAKMGWNWGPAASPIVHEGVVYLVNDNEERSSIVALDGKTGKELWRQARDEKSNWSTPIVWVNEKRTEIITSGSGKVRSYDTSGKLLWTLSGMSSVTVPTPVAGEGLLFISSGCQHSRTKPIYAIRPGASGDISLKADEASNEFVAWKIPLAAPYVPSPVVYDGRLYVLYDRGTLACFDAKTGKEIYGPQRLEGQFSASPVAADGKVYCLSESGETFVLGAGDEFKILSRNRLGETIQATPAITGDAFLVRTLTKLYAIAPAEPAPPQSTPASDPAFRPDDARMGDEQFAYIDSEFLQGEGRAVFLDSRMDVWVGDLDPAAGLFKTPTGRDHQIDTGISKWSRYSNGPEWGVDAKGPALFYVKDNAQGTGQLWRAEPPWDKPKLSQLTRDTDIHNWICEPSINPALASTRVITYRGKPGGAGNVDAWIDEDRPDQPKELTRPMVVARWAHGTSFITFAHRARPGQAEPSQVVMVDTDTGQSRVITADEGNKIDPWLWRAPEFGSELLLSANVDDRVLAIYRDVKRDGSPWQRIATLTLPATAPHQTLKSVEPINGGRGASGRSYFTVQAGDDKDKDTSIWLFGFSPDGRHLIRRLDDGEVTGKPARRLDPESYIGAREIFVYYTLVGNGPSQLRRCRTGIEVKGKS